MRLFIGATPGKAAPALCHALSALKGHARGGFVDPINLHVTLQFLGDKSAADIPAVERAMRAAAQCEPLRVALSAPGRFAQRDGSVVWYGVNGAQALFALQERLEHALTQNGVSFKAGVFTPHITLARRVQPAIGWPELFCRIAVRPQEFTIDEIILFESARVEGKLHYIPVFTQRLRVDAK